MHLTKDETLRLVNLVYRQYQRSAKKRGHSFELPLNVFGELILQDCGFCGAPPSNLKRSGILYLEYNGIDRLDSSIGYVESNCVPCCRFCNSLKGAMPANTWLDFINSIVELHGGERPYPGVRDPGRPSKSYYNKRRR